MYDIIMRIVAHHDAKRAAAFPTPAPVLQVIDGGFNPSQTNHPKTRAAAIPLRVVK